jgi:hypothetical protein
MFTAMLLLLLVGVLVLLQTATTGHDANKATDKRTTSRVVMKKFKALTGVHGARDRKLRLEEQALLPSAQVLLQAWMHLWLPSKLLENFTFADHKLLLKQRAPTSRCFVYVKGEEGKAASRSMSAMC